MRVAVRIFRAIACAFAGVCLFTSPVAANIHADIDLAKQRMTVVVDGDIYATWPISTARRGYVTPVGDFHPYLLKLMHYSKKYDNSPMPHSVFFRGGYAIHGTYYVKSLGRPVSHGCVRLHPDNAARLYSLVLQHGFDNTTIIIHW